MIVNKKKLLRNTAMILASATLMLIGTSSVYSGTTDATVKSYEDQLAEIAWKKQQALTELGNIDSDRNSTYNDALKLDQILQLNAQQMTLVENQLDTINTQIAEKTSAIADTTQKIETQQQAFLDRMVANYMDQDIEYMELILGSTDLVDFLTRMDSVNAIIDYDRKIIDELEKNRAILVADQKTLEEAQATQVQRANEYAETIKETQIALDQKYDYMQQLKEVEATWVAEYSYQKELENEINAELERYLWELAEKQRKLEEQQKLEAQKYQAAKSGWPLQAGVNWYVSSPFGWRNLYGVQDYHLGIDLACANGTDVLAFNSGTVLKSEYHWSYGNYVLIDHGGGIATLYAHLSDRWVSAGDTVTSGQQIGNVGLTGTTFGYHLHFEVRENGSVTDPAPYLGLY